jgi:hypothetical protein
MDRENVIEKYVKNLDGLIQEIRKIPSEIKTAITQQSPPYENAVIFLFGYLFKFFKFEELPEFNDEFPDAQVMLNGELLFIEFEALSSDFERHGHDKEMCNLIVCWRHDWDKCPNNIEVIALEEFWKQAKSGSL